MPLIQNLGFDGEKEKVRDNSVNYLNSVGWLELIYRKLLGKCVGYQELLANRGLTEAIIFAKCGGSVAIKVKGKNINS
ncbi:MAG: hypothetical protein DKT66_04800 [Candidatus Melainabacteria bacterium]|nr:MAG: hypothetical protein DKT66_04800 [Candidatus Melainabacteria bacterium]